MLSIVRRVVSPDTISICLMFSCKPTVETTCHESVNELLVGFIAATYY
jgi:hypothetical protein